MGVVHIVPSDAKSSSCFGSKNTVCVFMFCNSSRICLHRYVLPERVIPIITMSLLNVFQALRQYLSVATQIIHAQTADRVNPPITILR